MGVNRDDVDDLLAAWALDAVDAADRDAVDAVLAVDPERARVARALQHTVAALGDVVAESPPPETRMNVLRAAAARGRDSARSDAGPAALRTPGRIDDRVPRRARRRRVADAASPRTRGPSTG